MRYYRAYETNGLPKLLFELVADTLDELQELGLEGDALVVTEDQLLNPADPEYIKFDYGICHSHIFNGKIEPRPAGEISAQQTAAAKAAEVTKTKSIEESFDTSVFTYDGHEFPMTPAARSLYMAIFDDTPLSQNIVSTTGAYALIQADIDKFKAAYYAAIYQISDAKI